MEQKPTIGRIVLYQKYGTPGGEHLAEPSPAVITKVESDGSTKDCIERMKFRKPMFEILKTYSKSKDVKP